MSAIYLCCCQINLLFVVFSEFVKRCHNWFYSPLHKKFTRCGGAVFIKCLYKHHVTGEFFSSFFCANNITVVKLMKQCQEDLNSCSLGELKETTGTPSYCVDEDYPVGLEIQQPLLE